MAPSASVSIEVFADACCPFAHVVLRRLVARRNAGRANFHLRIRAWPIELVDGELMSPSLVAEEADALRAQADPAAFAGFAPSRFPTTSLPAFALSADAYEQSPELGERVSLALGHALFEEGRDISDPAVLTAIAAEQGVASPSARRDVTVRSDWKEGRDRGVHGSPHFFAGGASYFCPGLDIRRVSGRLAIAVDDAGLDELLAAARRDSTSP